MQQGYFQAQEQTKLVVSIFAAPQPCTNGWHFGSLSCGTGEKKKKHNLLWPSRTAQAWTWVVHAPIGLAVNCNYETNEKWGSIKEHPKSTTLKWGGQISGNDKTDLSFSLFFTSELDCWAVFRICTITFLQIDTRRRMKSRGRADNHDSMQRERERTIIISILRS